MTPSTQDSVPEDTPALVRIVSTKGIVSMSKNTPNEPVTVVSEGLQIVEARISQIVEVRISQMVEVRISQIVEVRIFYV